MNVRILMCCLLGSILCIAADQSSLSKDSDRSLIEIMQYIATLGNDQELLLALDDTATISDEALVKAVDSCIQILDTHHDVIEDRASLEQLCRLLSAYRSIIGDHHIEAPRPNHPSIPPQDTLDKPELPELPRDLSARNVNIKEQLRLFENIIDEGNDFVGFRALDDLPATYILTMPIDAGLPNQALATDGTGVLFWETVATGTFGGTILPGTDNAAAKYLGTNTTVIEPSLLNISDLNPFPQQNVSLETHPEDTTLALLPSGVGAIITSTQGNPRGNRANDLQRSSASPTQVASGDFSFIGGGR